MTARDLYELQLVHQKAREEDARKRAENRADVAKRWPATVAWIDHLFEQGVRA